MFVQCWLVCLHHTVCVFTVLAGVFTSYCTVYFSLQCMLVCLHKALCVFTVLAGVLPARKSVSRRSVTTSLLCRPAPQRQAALNLLPGVFWGFFIEKFDHIGQIVIDNVQSSCSHMGVKVFRLKSVLSGLLNTEFHCFEV